jgi:hypothetical protein
MKKVIVLAAMALIFTSCYNTRIVVGDMKPTEPVKEVNKVWTHHFLFGLIPGGNATAEPENFLPSGTEDYMVKTNQNFWNSLVGSLTIGIYTPTQTKYYVPYGE